MMWLFFKLHGLGLIPKCIHDAVERIANSWGYPLYTMGCFGVLYDVATGRPRFFVEVEELARPHTPWEKVVLRSLKEPMAQASRTSAVSWRSPNES